MRLGDRIKAWIIALAAAGLASGAALAQSVPAPETAKTEHLEVRLAPQTAAAIPGSTLYVALRHKIVPDWHTYWRNSGDAGQATTIAWTLPPGWKAGEIVWPKPKPYMTGPLMNYVFEGDVYLPVPIEVPADAKPGETVRLTAAASFLVCAEICVPEDATVSVTIPVAATAGPDPRFGDAVAKALADAPKVVGLAAAYERQGDKIRLAVTGDELVGLDAGDAYFFPYDGGVILHAAPQMAERGEKGLTLTLSAAPEGNVVQRLDGVLSLGDKAFVVEAAQGAAPPGASGLGPAKATRPGGGAASSGADMGLLAALAFAFVGGLILNLMPCVFPVLSMKAAALARHAEHPSTARLHGLVFLVGVVTSFMVLAGLLIVALSGGEASGWGFHLQNPFVVSVLALLMLLVGLNLSGVFAVGHSVQGVGAAGPRTGLAGAFFTGVLAVVVAAPCTAPFMAATIGWAVTQPAIVTLAVFAALGLGLAAPFTLLSFAPGLFRKLPKPGAWMEVLRNALAFPMYGAAAWLAWVFAVQTGPMGLPFLLGAGVAIAFAAWAWGLSQTADRKLAARIAALVGVVLALPLIVLGARVQAPATASGASAPVAGASVSSEPWSPERVAELRAEGRPVFVDFTAAWCVTCQVNERTALAGPKVAAAFEQTNAVFLKADWTNRNAEIAKALAEHGRSGVPLYLVYGKTGEPVILPQLLTEGMVVQALAKAAG